MTTRAGAPADAPTFVATTDAPLDGLLTMPTAPAARPDLRASLQTVAATISATLQFATVVVNVYEPAFDEFEVVAVHGGEAARARLLGHRSRAEEWKPIFDERFLRRSTYFIPHGSYDWGTTVAHVPSGRASHAPDAWHPEDGLFVPLRSAAGATIGVLSVDEPVTGRRPTDHDLDVLAAVAAQAGLVIESTQQADTASRHRAEVESLLRVSSRLNGRRRPRQVMETVCCGIHDALGFERVAALLVDNNTQLLSTAAVVGWAESEWRAWGTLALSELDRLLATESQSHGCVLLAREEAHALTPSSLHRLYSSQLNGRGPHAWRHHWLIVPLHGEDGSLLGIIWADDPVDRLLPSPERLQALRTFANQGASALEAARSAERLRHLAEHDPMTGLRNRRGLHEAIDEAIVTAGSRGVALIVADVDAFKRINDDLGYVTGDRVLRAVASAVGDRRPKGGLAVRLGGEEFALMLPAVDLTDALAVANEVRAEAGRRAAVPWGLTMSAGIAMSGPDQRSADALLRAATRALHAAKRLGRDRCEVYEAARIEPVLAALERDDGRDNHHLAAVMLLAETLDLRDAGTARHCQTVGDYARRIALALDFAPERVERMRIAGVLHDLGKMAVADAVLHKPGTLSEAEWDDVRRHCEVGARILDHAGLRDISGWVYAHHERLDGTGYPRGLKGIKIPLESRILAVADAYEAMTSARAYRPVPLTPSEARAELRRRAGTQFDPDVVATFIRLLDEDPS